MLIAVASTLNIGLAIMLSLLLTLPLSFARPRKREWSAALQQLGFIVINPLVAWGIWRVLEKSSAEEWMKEVLIEFAIGESWLVSIICIAVVPVLLQGATATLL